MQFSNKIGTAMPLTDVQIGTKIYKRTSDLTKADLKAILREGEIHFVVANVGDQLRIIDSNKCFEFWKKEVEEHLVYDTNNIDLDCYPNNYAYIASLWTGQSSNQLILLEKFH